MKQELQNLEIFTRDFAKPCAFEILNHEPDCGGGESIALWSSVLATIVSAVIAAEVILGGVI